MRDQGVPGGGDGGQGVCLSRSPGETRPWCQKGRKDTLPVPRPLGISSLASRQLISACQRAMRPLARPTLGGFPTWPLDGGGARGPLRTLALPSTPGHPSPALCLHAVPALHGGGVLRACRAAWSPLQQDPLLPGPVSNARGPRVVVQGPQGVTWSEEGKAMRKVLG